MGFTYDSIEDLKIATSEAITNAVQHAYKDKRGKLSSDLDFMETGLRSWLPIMGQALIFKRPALK